MTFSDWIKAQLDALRALVMPAEDPPGVTAAGTPKIEKIETSDKLILRFLSDPANVSGVRKSIENFSATTSLDTPAREEVGLVVNEAVANVMRHAYENARDRPVEVIVLRKDGGVKIEIRDWGNRVDPSTIPVVEKDPFVPGGLGLLCMRRLMDDVTYEVLPDGVRLSLVRTTPGSKVNAAPSAAS